MRPTFVLFATCLCLASTPVPAAEALDLSLPDAQVSTYRNDPPGTWYGDTSGVPVAEAGQDMASRRSACPTSPDGEETPVTGSVTTGMGYSSRMGSSTFGAASVNYCKSYPTASGGERTVNVHVDVGSYDGPGYYGPGYYDHGYDAGLHGPAPGPAMNPWMAPGPGPAGRGAGRGLGRR